MALIKVTIDGKEVKVGSDATILTAAAAAGVNIPTLCYDPILSEVGACRVCVVEVEGARALVPACSVKAADGMVVRTDTERVIKARKLVVDLLLSAHPQDCMTCDKAGACTLQDLAYELGIERSTFHGQVYEDEIKDDNPFYVRDYAKCIMCGKCIRMCLEVQGNFVLGFANRGFDTRVSTAYDNKLADSNCVFCGNCVAVCPTGALQEKAAVGQGRNWELTKTLTTCSYCGVGCQFDLNVDPDGNIVKATSNPDAHVNGVTLCVKGRFGWDFVQSPERLTTPLILEGEKGKGREAYREASWDEAYDLIKEKLSAIKDADGPDSIGFLSSAKCTNEENYLLVKLARAVMGTNNVDHCARL